MAAAKGNALGKLGKLTELRQRIFFVVGALIVFGVLAVSVDAAVVWPRA